MPCITLMPELAQADNDIHKIFPIILIIRNIVTTMKSQLLSKRTREILDIGLKAIGIGAISKKIISYPTGGCIKDTQELTLNESINKFFI